MRASRPGQSALLLVDVVETLRSEELDYLVIGAFALSVHGVVRASTDADALIDISRSRVKQLRNVFVSAGFRAELRLGDDDDPIPAMLVLSDPHGNRVDVLGGLRGLDPKAFKRGIDVAFQDETLRFVGREDFIAMKCFAQGPQDLLDAKAAYRAAQRPLDLDLMRRLALRYGPEAANRLREIL